MTKNQLFFSPKLAAVELGLSERRVQQFCEEGRIGRRIGTDGPYFISAAELEAFAEKPRPCGRRPGKRIKKNP